MADPTSPDGRNAADARRKAREWADRMTIEPERYQISFDEWLAENPARQTLYDAALVVERLTQEAGAAIHAKMQEDKRNAARASKRRLALAAAGVCFLLGSGFAVHNLSGGRDQPVPMVAARAQMPAKEIYETKVGEVRVIRLADGSKVTLDSDSRMLVRLAALTRNIDLVRGRARFAVSHDPARPFSVFAGGGRATALGTVFDVATPGACSIIVVQIEGRVEVTLPCQPAAHKRDVPIRLQPGNRLVYDATHANQVADPISPATGVDEGWVSGLIPYRGDPVSRVIADVNRYSSITIVASTPEIADMRVRANLNIRSPLGVAEHLAVALDLVVDDSEPGTLVLRKRQ